MLPIARRRLHSFCGKKDIQMSMFLKRVLRLSLPVECTIASSRGLCSRFLISIPSRLVSEVGFLARKQKRQTLPNISILPIRLFTTKEKYCMVWIRRKWPFASKNIVCWWKDIWIALWLGKQGLKMWQLLQETPFLLFNFRFSNEIAMF